MHFLNPASSPTRADRVNIKARGASLRSAPSNPEAADLPGHIAAGALAASLAALLLAAVSMAARLGSPEVHVAYLTGDSGAVATTPSAELQHALGAAQASAQQAISHAAMELRSGLEGAMQTQKLAAGLGVTLAAGSAPPTHGFHGDVDRGAEVFCRGETTQKGRMNVARPSPGLRRLFYRESPLRLLS